MNVYMDTSVFLRRVLNQPGALQAWSDWKTALTSELMEVEARRTLARLRALGTLNDSEVAERLSFMASLMASFDRVPIDRAILSRAGSPFPTAVGTLDAIHLATALLWVEEHDRPLMFLTHDRELALAARACGLQVNPPA